MEQRPTIKRKAVEDKIDEFNKQTFPASDPPNWSSIQHMVDREKQLQHFKVKLEVKRDQLLASEQQIQREGLVELSPTETGEISHVRTHNADLGTQEFDQELDLEVAEQESNELQEIEAALFRIKDGVYGRCEHCGREIPLARLEAQPEARYCVNHDPRASAARDMRART